jgi:predicted MFS family arabinose efflux permease
MTYFMLVFGAGFVSGSIRVPFLVPRLGERAAELIEMPFMLVVIVLSAQFITRRFSLPPVSCSASKPDL